MTNLTIKQEKFCQKYIETGNASEAYRQSYDVGKDTAPETIWNDAYKLMKNPDVSARVLELKELAKEMHFVTVGTITAELEEARDLAKQEKQSAPMISASMGKAKLHGLISEKHEMTGKDGGPIETKDTTPMDFAKRAAFLLAAAAKELENGNKRTDD